MTLNEQSVDAINQLATPGLFQRLKLHFLARIVNILPQVLYSHHLLKRQSEFSSFCKLHTFSIFHIVISSLSYKIYFLYFTNCLNARALLQLAEPDWINWSYDKDYILGLADLLCHIT